MKNIICDRGKRVVAAYGLDVEGEGEVQLFS